MTPRGPRSGQLLGAAVATLALIGSAHTSALAGDLSLEPSGPRTETTATWVEGAGPNAAQADEVLLLRKDSDVPMVGAIVLVRGVDGASPSEMGTLAWDRRGDSACSVSAPRWGIAIEGKSGTPYVAYLPCLDAQHTSTGDDRWMHDEFSAETVQQAIKRVGGTDSTQGRVRAVAILFTEGPSEGPGFAYLDNVSVNGTVWQAAAPGQFASLP